MLKTQAEYLDGISSRAVPVEISFNDDGSIVINGEGVRQLCLLEDVSFSPRLGNIPRVMTLSNNATCHIADNELVDEFLRAHKKNIADAFIHRLESSLIYVLTAVLFTAIFTWGMSVYGIPYLSKQIAFNLPADVDRMLGQGTLETLDKVMFTESQCSAAVQQRLRVRFERMKQGIDGAQDYQLLFRGAKKIGANAIALPSGIVVVTDELVALSDNDDEVVAVLAHEIGHLQYRHSVRMVLQNSAITVLVATITGDPVSSSSLIAALPTILVNASYSREFETEADDYAYRYLSENNIPLSSFASILNKISEQAGEQGQASEIENYLSTHPATEKRVQRFK